MLLPAGPARAPPCVLGMAVRRRTHQDGARMLAAGERAGMADGRFKATPHAQAQQQKRITFFAFVLVLSENISD